MIFCQKLMIKIPLKKSRFLSKCDTFYLELMCKDDNYLSKVNIKIIVFIKKKK